MRGHAQFMQKRNVLCRNGSASVIHQHTISNTLPVGPADLIILAKVLQSAPFPGVFSVSLKFYAPAHVGWLSRKAGTIRKKYPNFWHIYRISLFSIKVEICCSWSENLVPARSVLLVQTHLHRLSHVSSLVATVNNKPVSPGRPVTNMGCVLVF